MGRGVAKYRNSTSSVSAQDRRGVQHFNDLVISDIRRGSSTVRLPLTEVLGAAAPSARSARAVPPVTDAIHRRNGNFSRFVGYLNKLPRQPS